MKVGQIKRCQRLGKFGRHVVGIRNPPYCFLIDWISKAIVLFRSEICLSEKRSTFYCCFHKYPLGEAGLAG